MGYQHEKRILPENTYYKYLLFYSNIEDLDEN
jgi:hypothetical protein